MSKLAFPTSHTEKIVTQHSPEGAICFESVGSDPDHAQVIHDLVHDLTVADFRGALQDPRTKERYKTVQDANQRVEELKASMNNRRPIGAYILNLEEEAAYPTITPVGLCVFGREKTRLPMENGSRTLAAWYRSDAAKQFDRLPVDNAIMRGAVAIARKARVHTLCTTIGKSLGEARLVLPDATLDLPKLFGFIDQGERLLAVEERTYPGRRYEKTF